ncbi:TonB-dependent receptor [Pedobacter sp. MC2016-24]|uniref:SusC/RagA family TonB-linked outer membrane protein n=1 Tax=Pedobacter sp. MC2016-24 TaxID=2780090 RepID=UPI00188236E6|nr:TonB-dependent receptor [Pedobacter sp. MC2016-24]MBE9602823.1 TonB-dependent receptor [Pedobacter sp. MC2016-24]
MKRVFTKLSVLTFLCFLFTSVAQAQNITVKGTVKDGADQTTLPGVSIQVKGSTAAVQTDASGNYAIAAPSDATLVFTYIGYTSKEVLINNQVTINVTLSSASQELEGVVVVGYGTQRKRDLTGSITQIKGDEIAKMPNTNPVSSLQGKVPGLTVVNSGTPGAAPTVRIRGINSTTTSGSDPLYVVDGVHQSNIDYLNPGDIESIEVLKDPSSIAIFGLQAGNGVIVVTTKRAAKGETRIALQSSAGVQKVINKIAVTDAAQFRKLYDNLLANSGAAPFDYTNYTANTDWQKEILQSAFQSNNSLSISNSGEKSTTLINLGYNTQEGVVKFGKYQRYVARLNEEIRINSNIKVGADLTGTHWILNSSNADLNSALWAAPIVGVRESETAYYSMPSFQRTQVGNPMARIYQNNGNNINKGYRAVGSLFAEIKFLKQFKWRSQFYTDLGFNNSRGYTALPFTVVNLGEGTTPTDRFNNPNARTSVRQNTDEFRKFQQDHTITYDTTFNNTHKITAVAGFTTIFESSTNLSGDRTDIGLNIPNDPSFWYIGIAEKNNPSNVNGGGAERSSMGYFARVNYAYKDKYLLNATYRRDGISKLAPQNRWGNFGGFGLGWVLSEENFFKNIKGINFLKLRGSWGTTGNGKGIDDNIFRPGLTTSGSGVFGDFIYPGVAPAYIADPALRWEVVRGVDLGLDLKALNNRLTAEFNVYDRTTKDIITQIQLLSSGTNLNYRTNLGSISNKGVELSLGWNDKIGDSFTYNVTPNVSYNTNKVVSIGNTTNYLLIGNGGANRTITGESIGHFYGYRQIGIYQSTADLDKMPRMPNSLPGDIAYADLNGDGKITPEDRENLGSPFPAWSYGLNVNFGYKGFDLLLQGQGVAGNYVYAQRRTAAFADLNFESNRLNAWTGPGTSNVEPILQKARGNNYLFSSYYLEPGDYFRLRTLQLGYTFKPNALVKAGVKSLRLYLSGQNLYTWTKTTGYSPEAPISSIIGGGADNGVYPIPAVYTFGINATF